MHWLGSLQIHDFYGTRERLSGVREHPMIEGAGLQLEDKQRQKETQLIEEVKID